MDNFFRYVKSFGSKTNQAGQLHPIAKLAASKFDNEEIRLLQLTWLDLADRSNGKGIDKDTFLQYFPLNGLLGERLFVQFDTKKTGFIDFDDFIIGLSRVCRGTQDDKIHFIFDMYDIAHDNSVSKEELTTLLNHIPKNVLQEHFYSDQHDGYESASSTGDGSHAKQHRADDLDEVDMYTNHDLVERAFEECDINHTGRLSYEEFKMWVEKNPAVMEYIESILPYHGPKENTPRHDKVHACICLFIHLFMLSYTAVITYIYLFISCSFRVFSYLFICVCIYVQTHVFTHDVRTDGGTPTSQQSASWSHYVISREHEQSPPALQLIQCRHG